MQFNDEATSRIAIHRTERLVLQHKEEIQKSAYKMGSGFFIRSTALSKNHFLIWTI